MKHVHYCLECDIEFTVRWSGERVFVSNCPFCGELVDTVDRYDLDDDEEEQDDEE